jgi:hypothetical protein
MTHGFRLLVTILVTLLVGNTLLGEGNRQGTHLSVRQKADSILHNLILNLSKAKLDDERLNLIARSNKAIQVLRDRSPMQFLNDEIYLDAVASGLKRLSSSRSFSAESCDLHRAALLGKTDSKKPMHKPASAMRVVFEKVCQ